MLPSQLSSLRRVNVRYCVTPAVVTRAGVTLAYVMPDGSALRCRITLDKEGPILGASRLEQQRRWVLHFPDGLDIRAGDQIQALGNIYGVVDVDNPTSYSVQTSVRAYMLFDSNGVPVFLRPNATMATRRDGVVGNVLTGQRVRIVPATYVPAPEGPRRQQLIHTVLGLDIIAADYADVLDDSGFARKGIVAFVDPIPDTPGYMALTVDGGLLPA